mmetsp:Transcript_132827/g.283834  ORF Transcript_132827/g.283834 Transcript_132827/m.283834 type:complete len:212 (+) Transcript_132827:188-823(+)
MMPAGGKRMLRRCVGKLCHRRRLPAKAKEGRRWPIFPVHRCRRHRRGIRGHLADMPLPAVPRPAQGHAQQWGRWRASPTSPSSPRPRAGKRMRVVGPPPSSRPRQGPPGPVRGAGAPPDRRPGVEGRPRSGCARSGPGGGERKPLPSAPQTRPSYPRPRSKAQTASRGRRWPPTARWPDGGPTTHRSPPAENQAPLCGPRWAQGHAAAAPR